MRKVLRKLMALLEPGERVRLVRLFFMMMIVAVLQMIGVASIMPFMSLVAEPQAIHENEWLSRAYETIGFSNDADFLFLFGILVLLLIAVGNGMTGYTNSRLFHFAWDVQHELSVRLLKRYLSEPYPFFLNRNTAALSKNILAEVREVIAGIVVPGLKMVSQGVVSILILGLLLAVDARVAITAAVVLGGAFGLVYMLVRRKQAALGKRRSNLNTRRFRVSNEALAGIKETKVLQREMSFLERFEGPSREYSRAHASNAIMSELPRYFLETLAFGGIVGLILFQIAGDDDFSQAIGVISLYAFAGYRLLPSLQQIFHGLAKIRFFRPALESLYDDLKRAESLSPPTESLESVVPMPFEREIEVAGLRFRYPLADDDVIRDISLTIPKNSTVGFVGGTGSGKTTLVDILLGLLDPTGGEVRIDGEALRPEVIQNWRRRVGYVPQQIFLMDDTIAMNIAFGQREDELDMAAVEKAARLANLSDFIATLPDGFQTVVGDRGIRLSGGQRQRIGIARALYTEPDVLFLDEATSALDGATEDSVMSAISSLAGNRTIIIVAHRLTTLTACDNIFLFKHGRVHASGTYNELIERNEDFRTMAKLPPVGIAAVS